LRNMFLMVPHGSSRNEEHWGTFWGTLRNRLKNFRGILFLEFNECPIDIHAVNRI
jgi:hypothetical protein